MTNWSCTKEIANICGSDVQAYIDHHTFELAIDLLSLYGKTFRDWERTYPGFDTAESYDLQIMSMDHFGGLTRWLKRYRKYSDRKQRLLGQKDAIENLIFDLRNNKYATQYIAKTLGKEYRAIKQQLTELEDK